MRCSPQNVYRRTFRYCAALIRCSAAYRSFVAHGLQMNQRSPNSGTVRLSWRIGGSYSGGPTAARLFGYGCADRRSVLLLLPGDTLSQNGGGLSRKIKVLQLQLRYNVN